VRMIDSGESACLRFDHACRLSFAIGAVAGLTHIWKKSGLEGLAGLHSVAWCRVVLALFVVLWICAGRSAAEIQIEKEYDIRVWSRSEERRVGKEC